MNTEQSLQYYLDALGQLPGCVLYRDTLQWKALAPGASGQILTLNSSLLPTWQTFDPQTLVAMFYPGTNGSMDRLMPTLGQQFTLVSTFSCTARAGASFRTLCNMRNNTAGQLRMHAFLNDNSAATNPGKLVFEIYDNAAVLKYRNVIATDLRDGLLHTLFWSYRASDAASVMRIDRNLHNPQTALTATLYTTTQTHQIGRINTSGTSFWNGYIGFHGYKEQYRTNYQDFFDANNEPIPVDEGTWAAWGGIPYNWNPYGDMMDNRGSLADWNRLGTIYVRNPN